MLSVICPSCNTKYQDNKKSIAMGDEVKCCICTYNWIISPRSAVYNEANNNKKLNDIRHHKNYISFSNTKFIISSIILLFFIALFAKDEIASTFPATQDIYHKLGLIKPNNANNKILIVLTSNTHTNAEENSMVLKGIIHNKLATSLKNPKILVELLNNKGNLIENHQIKLDYILKANQAEVFRIVIQNPSFGISSVKLKYIK